MDGVSSEWSLVDEDSGMFTEFIERGSTVGANCEVGLTGYSSLPRSDQGDPLYSRDGEAGLRSVEPFSGPDSERREL